MRLGANTTLRISRTCPRAPAARRSRECARRSRYYIGHRAAVGERRRSKRLELLTYQPYQSAMTTTETTRPRHEQLRRKTPGRCGTHSNEKMFSSQRAALQPRGTPEWRCSRNMLAVGAPGQTPSAVSGYRTPFSLARSDGRPRRIGGAQRLGALDATAITLSRDPGDARADVNAEVHRSPHLAGSGGSVLSVSPTQFKRGGTQSRTSGAAAPTGVDL